MKIGPKELNEKGRLADIQMEEARDTAIDVQSSSRIVEVIKDRIRKW